MTFLDWWLIAMCVALLGLDYARSGLLAVTENLLWSISPENMREIHGSRTNWVIKRRHSPACFIPLPMSCFEEGEASR